MIFVLALILMEVRVHVVGDISLTEIFVLFQFPFLIKWVRDTKLPYLRTLCLLFLSLIIVQAIAEFMVGNVFVNAIRGIAITLMTVLLFLFFLRFLCRDISLIKWIPLALLLRLILFGDQFGFAEVGEATYFKFYVAPIISYIVCYFSMTKNRFVRKNILWIFLVASLIVIAGGARSVGFSLLFSTLFCVIYNRYKTIDLMRILPGLLVMAIFFQLFYAFIYVPKVVSGEWGSRQNREQLARIDNSKNVFMMLFSARSDFYVAYLAFLDKPLWGHGAWAKDENFKYTEIQAELFPNEKVKIDRSSTRFIPSHSVVMAMGTRNGIFSFMIFLGIFLFVYYIGIKALCVHSLYNVYLIYVIISSFQHLLFGPPAILKNEGSIVFAIFFILYYLKEADRKRKHEIQITRCYSNV